MATSECLCTTEALLVATSISAHCYVACSSLSDEAGEDVSIPSTVFRFSLSSGVIAQACFSYPFPPMVGLFLQSSGRICNRNCIVLKRPQVRLRSFGVLYSVLCWMVATKFEVVRNIKGVHGDHSCFRIAWMVYRLIMTLSLCSYKYTIWKYGTRLLEPLENHASPYSHLKAI